MATGRTNKQGGASVSLTGDAVIAEVLNGKTFYNTDPKTKLTGTMPNKVGSATIITPSTSDQTIPQGYYGGASGDGKVSGDADLISANIKSGVNIFGVAGNYDGVGNLLKYQFVSLGLGVSYVKNINYSGGGYAILRVGSTDSPSICVYFKNSLVSDSSGYATIDGINTSHLLNGYGTIEISDNVQLKAFYNQGTFINLSITGPGYIYIANNINSPANGEISIPFKNSFTTDSSKRITNIDGVTVSTSIVLLGYSI